MFTVHYYQSGAARRQFNALEIGDEKTGVTIMQMDKGLDTGEMILTAECTIEETDTSADLYEKLAQIGPKALIDTLSLMATNEHKAIKQNNELATYAHKLDKAEAELDWKLTASELDRKIRAYIPWPVAQFTFNEHSEKQHRIRVWQASMLDIKTTETVGTIISTDKNGIVVATGTGALCLEILQLPNKKALPIQDILNGRANWFKVGANINGLVN